MVGKRKKKEKDWQNLFQNSYAKINLFLDVLSCRYDNYHNIITLFSEINLCDQINTYLTEDGKITVLSDVSKISGNRNIVFKIAEFIKNKYGIKQGISITIKKRIPLGAGLGGGSSNAAVCLRILNQLCELELSEEKLRDIGTKFGSDINFFLTGGIAIGRNKGDSIEQIVPKIADKKSTLKIKLENILLVNPGIEISSHEAYSLVKLNKVNKNKFERILNAVKSNDLKEVASNLYNKLEDGLFKKYPLLKTIKNQLLEFSASGALLSGSGATLFGIFENREDLVYAKERFSNKGYWTFITRCEYPLPSNANLYIAR